VKSDDELEFQIESGSTVSRVYPWMTAQQYQRPLTVIETVEAESEQASGSCNIAANPARDSITAVLRITKLNKVDVMGALPQKTSRKMRQILLTLWGRVLPILRGSAIIVALLSKQRNQRSCLAAMSSFSVPSALRMLRQDTTPSYVAKTSPRSKPMQRRQTSL
jgi:hypothetical protein